MITHTIIIHYTNNIIPQIYLSIHIDIPTDECVPFLISGYEW